MIPDTKLVARAKKYVGGHKSAGVHPDVAARVASFQRAQDDETTSDLALQGHARALMNLVDAIQGAEFEDVEEIERRTPAKKTTAKRTAKKTSSRS